MIEEKLKVHVTETDKIIEALVYSKKASQIEIVFGDGVHSVKCALTPIASGHAYVGNVMGREVVDERGRKQV